MHIVLKFLKCRWHGKLSRKRIHWGWCVKRASKKRSETKRKKGKTKRGRRRSEKRNLFTETRARTHDNSENSSLDNFVDTRWVNSIFVFDAKKCMRITKSNESMQQEHGLACISVSIQRVKWHIDTASQWVHIVCHFIITLTHTRAERRIFVVICLSSEQEQQQRLWIATQIPFVLNRLMKM